MVIPDLWFIQESFTKKIKTISSKLNFKFTNILHRSKGHIYITICMNMVFMDLGYKHVNFPFIPVDIKCLCSTKKPARVARLAIFAAKSNSQTNNLYPTAATVHCDHINNILKVIKRLFVGGSSHHT